MKIVLTQKGAMKEIEQAASSGSFTAYVPITAEEMSNAEIQGPGLKLNLKKLPMSSPVGGYLQAYIYFAEVYKKYRSEAYVYWHFEASEDRYMMVVPPAYTATAGHVRYTPSDLFCSTCQVALFPNLSECRRCGQAGKRLRVIGTSHSHGSMPAFHSATDDKHELNQTGFHITFGNVDKGPLVCPSFVVSSNKTRFMTSWDDHFDVEAEKKKMTNLDLWLTLVDRGSGDQHQVVNDRDEEYFVGSNFECVKFVEAAGYGNIKKSAAPVYEAPTITNIQRIITEQPRPWFSQAQKTEEKSLWETQEESDVELDSLITEAVNEFDLDQLGVIYALQQFAEQLTVDCWEREENYVEEVLSPVMDINFAHPDYYGRKRSKDGQTLTSWISANVVKHDMASHPREALEELFMDASQYVPYLGRYT